MKHAKLLLYLFLQGSYLFVFAQSKQLHFEHIGRTQGISQDNILCIMQDSRGFMWFGSWDGLNKYDGYKTTVYKNDPHDSNSISNNYINGIAETKDGNIWIATNIGGMCRFNRKQENFTRFRHSDHNSNTVTSDITNCILADHAGMVWIGTQQGLDLFAPQTNTFKHFIHTASDTGGLSDNYIKCFFEDSNHNLWIGTANGGLNLFNTQTQTFQHFQRNNADSNSISGDNVNNIFEDSKHRLWIATNGNGLDLFVPATNTFRHFKNDEKNPNSLAGNTVLFINEDADNNLWISSENAGLSIFNYEKGKFTFCKNDDIDKSSIRNNSIYAIYRDRKNNMWLGNFAGAVDMLSRDKLVFTHYMHNSLVNSLSHNQVLSIMEDHTKKIWICTDGGGLNLFDPSTGDFTRFRHQKNNSNSICGDNVLNTCEDSDGNIWIGSWFRGLSVYNPQNKRFTHFRNSPNDTTSLSSNNAWKIFEDREKNIWVATFGEGLNLLNADHKTFTRFQFDPNNTHSISTNNVVNIYEDSGGNLWICTENGGLNLFNTKTKIFTRFLHNDTANSISNNSTNSVLEDSRRNLWIGTMMGLNKFDKTTGKFTVYSMADGLPGEYIYGILEDDKKNLWISSNNGITCFNPLTGVFKNFGPADGCQSNEYKQLAAWKAKNGMMYFGGINGFNEFNPDSVKTVQFNPQLVLTSFQIFNNEVPIDSRANNSSVLKQSISETKTITLPYGNSVFSFEFATLNYTGAEKKQYEYMLEGFDKNWNKAGAARTATYTNLDAATYFFKVRGLDNEGNWSPGIIRIELIIKPPFWLTWWFKALVILLLAGCILGIYRNRIRAAEAQQIQLKQQVRAQTQQLLLSAAKEQRARQDAESANKELKIKNKELEQFAYVASHDLQEPLRTTSGFVELIQKQYGGKLDERADKYLHYIVDASDRMKTLIKDLLDFSRIGSDKLFEPVDCKIVLANVLEDITAAIQESNAEICYADLPVVHGHLTEIQLLFQNLLINAIKFRKTSEALKIDIGVEQKDNYWQFSIADNGIGIAQQYSERIFDIFQRLHNRNEYKGSGIGLSHCKKIVELHSGKIWVESVPQSGSTFYFTLPREYA
ncbi:MAG: response regulator [Ferruginibacter sp.]|uniref:ligand-binding sensor domain-containing protein n=1 Tax=Ferruginibacter sp. TaxID=1940288 RepID=UPI00265930EE|nr:two-component regulator propeller domain-containing protein [Ferruginibacter sp.]MDB5278218.1 response regulator [Ferruginibacter sp.]